VSVLSDVPQIVFFTLFSDSLISVSAAVIYRDKMFVLERANKRNQWQG